MNSLHTLLRIFAVCAAFDSQNAAAVRSRDRTADGGDQLQLTIQLSQSYWKNLSAGATALWHSAHRVNGQEVPHVSSKFLPLLQSDISLSEAGNEKLTTFDDMWMTLVVIAAGAGLLVFLAWLFGSDASSKWSYQTPSSSERPPLRTVTAALHTSSAPVHASPMQPQRKYAASGSMPPASSPVQQQRGPVEAQGAAGAEHTLRTEAMITPSFSQPNSGAPNAKSLATALTVTSPEGAVLVADNKCMPHPEKRIINFRSARGTNCVLRARIDELSGQRRIVVETATGTPLTVVNTSGSYGQLSENRHINIHRVVAGSVHLLGSPCATVVPASPRTFQVRSTEQGKVILTIVCDSFGYIQEVQDSTGRVVMRQDLAINRGGPNQINLWMSTGADISLMVSIVLAVWKLA